MQTLACRSRCALCLTTLILCLGCQNPPPAPRIFHAIDVSLTSGVFSNDLHLTNKSGKRLNRVDLKLTIYNETEVKVVERHWSEWGTDEAKVVNFPAVGGSVERLTLTGTATHGVEAEPVNIQAEYSWKQTPAP